MMPDTNLHDYWIKFFHDAKIDEPKCKTYVSKFMENDMKPNCLRQLNENHLDKIGISSLGDQLSIIDLAKSRISDEAVVAGISTSTSTGKKKKLDQELFVVEHNRSEEQQNTINYRDLTNRVNFLIARELLKEAACGKDVHLLSKEGRIVYNKYRDVRNIFGHSREESRSNYQK